MGYALRPKERASWTPHVHRRRLPALLGALTTVLSLMLSACASVGLPADDPTPTPTLTLPRAGYCAGRAGRDRDPSSYVLAVTSPPIAANGAVYVGYAIPDPEGIPERHQYAIAALRARDGMPLWHVPVASETLALAVADGVLVVLGRGASGLIGLRASDGATLWHVDLSGFGTLSGGVLYLIESPDGNLYALRIADGRILWHSLVLRGLGSQPVVDGTTVYVAVVDGSIVALRADTGAIRWTTFPGSTPSPYAGYLPLAAAAGQLYVTTIGEPGKDPGVLRLSTVDGSSGGYVLRLPAEAGAEYPLLQAGVFVAVFLPKLPPRATPPAPSPTIAAYRLSQNGGEPLWRVPVQANRFTPTSVAHDAQTLYFAALPQGAISAFRLTDGAVLWQQRALASTSGIVAEARYLLEFVSGVDNSCHTPAIHQAPQIRMLSSTDGSVVWIHALDVTP